MVKTKMLKKISFSKDKEAMFQKWNPTQSSLWSKKSTVREPAGLLGFEWLSPFPGITSH